jgi:hypothetical protein
MMLVPSPAATGANSAIDRSSAIGTCLPDMSVLSGSTGHWASGWAIA